MDITGVSPAAWAAYRQEVTTKHQTSFTVSPDPTKTGITTGQINAHGVVVDYSYNANTEVASITVKHHPFWILENHITGAMKDALAKLAPVAK